MRARYLFTLTSEYLAGTPPPSFQSTCSKRRSPARPSRFWSTRSDQWRRLWETYLPRLLLPPFKFPKTKDNLNSRKMTDNNVNLVTPPTHKYPQIIIIIYIRVIKCIHGEGVTKLLTCKTYTHTYISYIIT